jgi:parallel beta-helix repeat protein
MAALVFAAPASADRYVDDNSVHDAGNNCASSIDPCPTIAQAISEAGDGEEIHVAPGIYPESGNPVDVNKRVHLEGAAAGLDARGRNASESEVLHGFAVNASGVSIDGFYVHGDGTPSTQTGMTLSNGESGQTIVNNIVTGFDIGIVVNSSGVSHTVVRHNDIHDNNAGNVQSAIIAVIGASDIEIHANRVANQQYNSIAIEGFASSDVSITDNTIANGGPTVLQNVHGGEISGNTITGSSHRGIDLAGSDSDIDIRGNVVSGSAGPALSLEDFPDRQPVPGSSLVLSTGADRGISVVGNDLSSNTGHGISVETGALIATGGTTAAMVAHFNRIVANTGDGINNGGTGSIDATNNWWGCNGGPGAGPGCASSVGLAAFSPWLLFGVTAERGRLLTDGDTNRITAGFSFNSALNAVDPSGFPATAVTFSAALGTVSPAATTTSAGVAHTLYTAGGTAGQGNATASADAQSVTTSNFEVSSQVGPQGNPGTNGTNGTNGAQGPQGEQGPPGPSTPATPAEPNPVLILSNSLRATKQRIVSVSISCPVAAGLCDGRLGLGVGASTLGNVAFLVRGGNRAVIRIKVTAKGLKTAIKKKKVTVVTLSRDNAGTAAFMTKLVKFRK